MTTVNEYLKNTRRNRIDSFIITLLFLILPTIGYAIVYFKDNYSIFYISIVFCIGFLLYFLIKPVYKIIRKNALWWEMNTIKIAPFGIGLLCIYWPPYRCMARKLVSDEAIRICENIVKNMKNNNDCFFENEWQRFNEWYPRIAPEWTSEKRFDLIWDVICQKIKHEEFKFDEERTAMAISMGVTHILTIMSVEKSLQTKLIPLADYKMHDLSQNAFEAEFEKRTAKFIQLKEDLYMTNSNEIFEKLFS